MGFGDFNKYYIKSYDNNMTKRVTIVIDDDLDKKLRLRQAKMIQQEQSSYSFSRVLNQALRKNLK